MVIVDLDMVLRGSRQVLPGANPASRQDLADAVVGRQTARQGPNHPLRQPEAGAIAEAQATERTT